MKVIDLLNKIANGEEVPKEIKYDTMNYVFRHYDYKEVYGELIDEQSSWLEKIDFYKLNDEVEIIEEDKKIEKLKNLNLTFIDTNVESQIYDISKKQIVLDIQTIQHWINKIIDYLEENKKC